MITIPRLNLVHGDDDAGDGTDSNEGAGSDGGTGDSTNGNDGAVMIVVVAIVELERLKKSLFTE